MQVLAERNLQLLILQSIPVYYIEQTSTREKREETYSTYTHLNVIGLRISKQC